MAEKTEAERVAELEQQVAALTARLNAPVVGGGWRGLVGNVLSVLSTPDSQVMTFVRHGVTAFAALLAAQGWASNSDKELLVSLAIGATGLALSIIRNIVTKQTITVALEAPPGTTHAELTKMVAATKSIPK